MDRRPLIESLRAVPGLAPASDAGLTRLAAHAELIDLAPRQVLFERGASADRIFVLVDGVIRVFQAFEERELTITHLTAPNTFGEMEVLAEARGGPHRGFLESTMALGEAEVLGIPAADFLAFLDLEPGCARALLDNVCTRFCSSATRELAVFFEVPTRLASLLLAYADLAGRPVDGGTQIKLELSHEDLAAGLGVTTKSIARALKSWQANDWVVRHKGWFLLKNVAALEQLCQGARFRLTT